MGLQLGADFDEADLIVRSARGDLQAFNLLVEQYQRPLYNLCLRMLNAPEAAEDATQDAFIAAYVSARGESFDEHMRRQIGAFRTYGLAYAARCGHDPKAAPIPGAAEEMLLRFGERYLVVRG